MEYLSLQDIPHRQYDPLHSRRMAPSQERQVGSMAAATQYMRSSPPIQPGETADKLPSFSEFLHKTRADTPPRTPQRRNGSADSSPHSSRPQFEDVAWQDRKRRHDDRNDTLGDIFALQGRPAFGAELPAVDPRRVNSVVEPPMHHHYAQQEAAIAPGYDYHRRQSSVYQPPHAHPRHHTPPVVPQAHAAYPQYMQPPAQGHPMYEDRRSYFQGAPPQPYAYDRPQDAYYGRPSYAGPSHSVYDNGYGDNIRFHQNVGVDHNAFNRKRRGNLPKEATNMFKAWYQDHIESPYPSEEDKAEMSHMTGLTLNQISNWFINARRRAPGKEAREKDSMAAAKRPGSDA